jgi:hypothetical protein
MGKIKRKARSTQKKKGLSLLKPITMEMMGTEEDPCFGKHLDPRTPECSRCGDSEICAVMMHHNNALLKAKAEKDNKFMDLEGDKLADPKEVKKKVKLRIRELIKIKDQPIEKVVDDVHNIYVMHGWSKPRIKKFINYLAENKDWVSIQGNLLKFHKK